MKPFRSMRPGTKLAGYDVLAEIGQGAASAIFLVQDPKTKQIWALKHVEKNTAKDQRFLDQTTSEAEIAQKIASPFVRNIERVIKSRKALVQVTEIFLLMEYVDGVSVEQHPPESFEQAVDIFLQTAKGLRHMHQCGFVHADMKPNNIVVTDEGRVKIIDLGQACLTGTVKERIQGTPDYIAPEQVHRREITPKTDIYNLGATMYWCLTQRHIPTAMPKDDSLLSSLDDKFIERPKPVHELNPRVPEAMNDLIMQSVMVLPKERPDDMSEVVEQLQIVQAGLRKAAAPAGAAPESAEPSDAG